MNFDARHVLKAVGMAIAEERQTTAHAIARLRGETTKLRLEVQAARRELAELRGRLNEREDRAARHAEATEPRDRERSRGLRPVPANGPAALIA